MRRAEIERLLPEVFQRTVSPGAPLQALLEVMEDLHAPDEDILEHLPEFFNAYRTDERYLTMLAHWVNLDPVFPPRPAGVFEAPWAPRRAPMPPGRLRALISAAPELARWRGTAHGLQRFLEIATGVEGYRLDEETTDAYGKLVPFHVRVIAPEAARPQRELIERIVELEKPAYVTWELAFE